MIFSKPIVGEDAHKGHSNRTAGQCIADDIRRPISMGIGASERFRPGESRQQHFLETCAERADGWNLTGRWVPPQAMLGPIARDRTAYRLALNYTPEGVICDPSRWGRPRLLRVVLQSLGDRLGLKLLVAVRLGFRNADQDIDGLAQ